MGYVIASGFGKRQTNDYKTRSILGNNMDDSHCWPNHICSYLLLTSSSITLASLVTVCSSMVSLGSVASPCKVRCRNS